MTYNLDSLQRAEQRPDTPAYARPFYTALRPARKPFFAECLTAEDAAERPYTVASDSGVGAALVVATLVVALRAGRGPMPAWLSRAVLCLALGAMAAHCIAGATHGTTLLLFLLFALYFAGKAAMYRFANYVFFERDKIITFRAAMQQLLSIETLIFTPLALVSVFAPVEALWVACGAVVVLVGVKIALVYRTNSIFFGKLYAILHAIVYLCTLEALPLSLLFVALRYTAAGVGTK